MNILHLIQLKTSIIESLNLVNYQIRNYKDGFSYITCLRVYGSIQYDSHTNEQTVQELCNEYTGDNGIVDVYTTNPDHCIGTYDGEVVVLSEQELKDLSKDNVSMSRAISNMYALMI